MAGKKYSFPRHMYHIFWQMKKIATNNTNGFSKNELLRTCLRLHYKSYLHRRWHKAITDPEQIIGYKFHYTNFISLTHLFKELFVKQEYHLKLDNDHPVIIDCGSNIGASIMYFKRLYPNSIITGFEPSSEVFEILQRNINENQLQDVKLYNMALSDKDGVAQFFSSPEDEGNLSMSMIQERGQGMLKDIQTTRLSKYIDGYVDLLKIDVEGAETIVIKDLALNGKLRYIKNMVIEYHHHINGETDKLSEILSIIENNGFGYQFKSELKFPFKKDSFQDMHIYAYSKT